MAITPSQLLLNLKGGSKLTATHDDLKVTLTFQRVYGKKSDGADLFSISKTCIPDIVLELDRNNERRTIIFDAKYRATWDSIHAASTWPAIGSDRPRTATACVRRDASSPWTGRRRPTSTASRPRSPRFPTGARSGCAQRISTARSM